VKRREFITPAPPKTPAGARRPHLCRVCRPEHKPDTARDTKANPRHTKQEEAGHVSDGVRIIREAWNQKSETPRKPRWPSDFFVRATLAQY